MVAMSVHPDYFHPHLRMSDRMAALAAWVLAVAIFTTVGWMALRPPDPEGAVTMLTDPSPWGMVVQMAALGAVVAAVTTVLVGRKLTDAGVFATCLGVAIANLRGKTLASVLIGVADGGVAVRRHIAASFILETVVWSLIVLMAMVVSLAVARWCLRGADQEGGGLAQIMSAANLPFIGRLLKWESAPSVTAAPDTGLRHTAACVVLAFILIRVFATGSPARSIAHGQVYFSVAAAFCAAGYLIQGYLPTRTPLWTCLSVPVVAIMAYLWTILTDTNQGLHPATIPSTPYFRALPVEYVMLGVLGSILSFWWTRGSYAARLVQRSAKRTSR